MDQKPEFYKDNAKSTQDLGNILNNFIGKSGMGAKLRKFSLFNHWAEIVGADIGKKTRPIKIFKETLYILVSSATWANELSMMSDKLMDKINTFAGENIVKRLRFKIQ